MAAKLGVTLIESSVNGHSIAPPGMATLSAGVPEPVEHLENYPAVLKALGQITDDRSEDIARVVGAAYDSGA